MNTKPSIRVKLIIIYFGEWPSYFPIFLESCRYNPDIQFLFFTDNTLPPSPPPNTKFIKLSLEQFSQIASKKIGIKIDGITPYKICDFRPTFGLLFSEELEGCSFWGHIDIDMVFGSISAHISHLDLSTFDVITARKEYLVGHFTLYRNESYVNELFMKSRHYKGILTRKDLFAFDECGDLWCPLLRGQNLDELNALAIVDSMTHVVVRETKAGNIRSKFMTIVEEQCEVSESNNLLPWANNLTWENGRLTDRNNTEKMYFHFHFLKRDANFVVPEWNTLPNKFYISNQGFSCLNDNN